MYLRDTRGAHELDAFVGCIRTNGQCFVAFWLSGGCPSISCRLTVYFCLECLLLTGLVMWRVACGCFLKSILAAFFYSGNEGDE